jgi:uncharacterized membrane protein SpoIIM required for sporulation
MSKKRRIGHMLIGMTLFAGAYAIVAEIPVEKEFAEQLVAQFEELIDGIDAIGITIHNLTIALVMFIPGVGVGLGIFIGAETGMAFSAMKTLMPALEPFPPLALLLVTPFGIMELVAYGMAMSRSYLIVKHRTKAKLKLQIRPIIIEIIIVSVLLLVAGQIEQVMIDMVAAGEFDLMEGYR